MYQIAHDRELSNEFNAIYHVLKDYDIIYTGPYSQCLVIVGAFSLDPNITLEEIESRTNGYIFERR